MKSTIYILGISSGDPELLTARAVQILRTAEIVLHDDSVSSEILDLIPASTQVRNVHKLDLQAGTLREKIHSLLVSAAREGHEVVRLIANDGTQPTFSNEEAEALAQAGVEYVVVPGAPVAVGAAAGAN